MTAGDRPVSLPEYFRYIPMEDNPTRHTGENAATPYVPGRHGHIILKADQQSGRVTRGIGTGRS